MSSIKSIFYSILFIVVTTTHILIAIAVLICPALLCAQEDPYPPGTIQMTPEVDLNLESVHLIVPEKFKGMVPEGDLNLKLPVVFSVKVFAASGLRGPRMMAFNKDVSIYNTSGQKVATLVDQRQVAGEHTVKWDAKDFSSGIYLYKIRAGSFEQSRKMILLR